MRSAALVTLLAAAASALNLENVDRKKQAPRIPGAYIFEFEEGHDSNTFFAKAKTEKAHTRMHFDYELFKGASVQFSDIETAEDKAAAIASLPSVKKMWPVTLYKMPKPKVEWQGSPKKQLLTSKKRGSYGPGPEEDLFSPHVMTQVDKLRAKGITGKGVKVAVVDTGIDYKHPALGNCFGEGCLVAFGTDLVGDDYDGFNVPVPDDDPMDCGGHGTHVAGIIAAQENSYNFTGVAPDVTLGAYRVFGCDGQAGNDVLIGAFNKAFEDGADIITASIGGPSGWSEDPWAVAVSRIVEKGVPCTVSAGNEGDSGLFYASTAANGKHVTAIASFDNVEAPSLLSVSHYSVDNGTSQQFGYTAAEPAAWADVKLPLWAPSFDITEPDGGCDPYPEDTPDLSDKIVLVRRGSCTFVQKAQNAAAKGAQYLIIYNNAEGTGSFDVTTVSGIKAAAMVPPSWGEEWIGYLKDGKEVVLTMEDPETADSYFTSSPNVATGGALSDFTTWGPTWEMDNKPQIGGVGGIILSTYPRAKGNYAVLSGTSMSCPQVAGIIALISQVRGTLEPAVIENLLSAYAKPQLFNDGTTFSDFLAPVAQQGGGLVQAYDAAYATVLLSPSGLSFNDTDNFIETLNFTLKNTGKKEVTFEISHVPAITMYTLANDTIYPDVFPNEPLTAHASIKFSENKVTVGAGESVTVEVLPTPPKGLDADRLPLWSGWVAINGTDGSNLSLPYQGLAGSLHDATVLGPEDFLVAKNTSGGLAPISPGATFTFPSPGVNATSGFPILSWFLALGTSKLHADLVPVRNSSVETTGKSIGQVAGFPLEFIPRDIESASLSWYGELDDGSFAPAGSYKIVLRALHIFGDEKKKEDWDAVESVPFRITYANN